MQAAAISRMAETVMAEIRPGLTLFQPNRLIWFSPCRTASRMVTWMVSALPGEAVSRLPANRTTMSRTQRVTNFLWLFMPLSASFPCRETDLASAP